MVVLALIDREFHLPTAEVPRTLRMRSRLREELTLELVFGKRGPAVISDRWGA